MIKKNATRVIAAALALTGILTSCGSPAQGNTSNNASTAKDSSVSATTTGTKEFKYGKVDLPGKDGSLCAAPTYIAYDKGFFAEEGFDINLISADSETRKIGLNNGSIPMVNGDFQFFPSIEEGVKVKVVDGLHYGCIKFIVPKDSPIKTVEDLKGKKIGVDEIGGTPHQVASVWLEKAGISAQPQDGEVSFLPYADGNLELEAVKNGLIDVAGLWDPLGSIAEKSGDYRVIFDLGKEPTFAGKYCCFLYASSKVIEEEPDKIAALLRAYQKAQNWISENPEEAVEIISSKNYSSIEDKELAKELIVSYAYPSTSDRASGKADAKKDVEYFAQELKNIGYLKTNDPKAFANDIYSEIDLKPAS